MQIGFILAFKTLYNAYHFRQFPGKLSWALSDLTFVYHAARGDLHYQILDLHRKYGTLALQFQ